MLRLVADGVGKRADLLDALNGVLAAMHTVAAVGLMIDPRDLGRVVGSRDGSGSQEAIYEPTLYLYDNQPGGIGLSERLFEVLAPLDARARETLGACRCQAGCPSCVGPVNQVGRQAKPIAAALLDRLRS